MSLSLGARLGPYEVHSALGVGGMGEVYRARDTRLNRDVALKVLPEAFLLDSDRLARFKREAQVLASLNHPNIAAIHGLEESTGGLVLVLELVDGPTLADRIAQGPVPLDEILPIARQIADALEAAHEHGVVHRDIKPSNIKVKSDGSVKVLDFGLAKALDDAPGGDPSKPSLTASPTLTSPAATRVGIILGTAAYMSPEQARGKSVDKRTDIWAFGCVLYEMLTGRAAFEGDEVSDVLARVIEREPDLTRLPPKTPAAVRRLLHRCLEKDRKRRLADAADVRLEIDEALAAPPEQPAVAASVSGRSGTARFAWTVSAALAVVAIAALITAFKYSREEPLVAPVVRSSVLPPEGTSNFVLDANIGGTAISPDGRQLAFVAEGGGKRLLYVRALDSLSARALPGTDEAARPFWSPDSRNLGFFARGQLLRIGLTDGAPRSICEVALPRGATWNAEGTIVFSTGRPGSLSRVTAGGGTAVPLTTLEESGVTHYWPQFLPDGRHFLYLVRHPQQEKSTIYVGSLDDAAAQPRRVRLVATPAGAVFAPGSADSKVGHLIFVQGSGLMAQPFDPIGLKLTGEAQPIGQNIGGSESNAYVDLSASRTGALAYGNATQSPLGLFWIDRNGNNTLILAVEPSRTLAANRLSPDGLSVIFRRDFSLWRTDLARSVTSRVTFAGFASDPVWSHDGREIVYRDLASVLRKRADGLEEARVLFSLPSGETGTETLLDWSDDGKFLLYQFRLAPGQFALSTVALAADGTAGQPVPFITVEQRVSGGARFSPGLGGQRWIVYGSEDRGKSQVYVQDFPSARLKSQISVDGGRRPIWSPDGKELFFQTDSALMAVAVKIAGQQFEADRPRELFKLPAFTGPFAQPRYDVSPDGQHFLFLAPVGGQEAGNDSITLVQNWQASLRP